MAVAYREIVFFLADRWFQSLNSERRACLRQNALYNLWPAHEPGQFGTKCFVPAATELLETRALLAPQGQLLAVIVPALFRHRAAGVDGAEDMTNVALQRFVGGVAGVDVDGGGVKLVEETLVERGGGDGCNAHLRAVQGQAAFVMFGDHV